MIGFGINIFLFHGKCHFSRSDVEDGGETVFPKATPKGGSSLGGRAKRGVSVKPKMGDALLFWSMRPDGSRDPKSLHGEITQFSQSR